MAIGKLPSSKSTFPVLWPIKESPLSRGMRVSCFLVCTYVLTCLLTFYFYRSVPAGSSTPNLIKLISGKFGISIASFLWLELGLGSVVLFTSAIARLLTLPKTTSGLHMLRGSLSVYVSATLLLFIVDASSLQVGPMRVLSYGELLHPVKSFLTIHIGKLGIVLLFISSTAYLVFDNNWFVNLTNGIRKKFSIGFSFVPFLRYFKIKFLSLTALFNRLTLWRSKVGTKKSVPSIEASLTGPLLDIFEPSMDQKEKHVNSSPSFSKSQTSVGSVRSAYAEKNDTLTIPQSDSPYHIPSTDMFKSQDSSKEKFAQKRKKENDETAINLVKILADFGVKGEVIGYTSAPMVNVYEFKPERGLKIAKVQALTDDLALALKVDSIIVSPISEKQAVGIEVPKTEREYVFLGDVLKSDEFKLADSPLQIAFGRSLYGKTCSMDLRKMPHLLMAGATGSGKSVAINSLICNVLMRSGPDDVKMIFVDPKMLELSVYEGIPQLLMPVITDSDRASYALKWAVTEMESRYSMMGEAKVRNIEGFNEYWSKLPLTQKVVWQENFPKLKSKKLPYILIVIDELCDLMMSSPKDVENSIQRLSQKARASGIHLVLATQRPSVDVITGVIKANLPCRAAFQVVSRHDSRTILDQVGAEKLLGNGDMFLQIPGQRKLERIQATFIGDEEVNLFVSDLKKAYPHAQYDDSVMSWVEKHALLNKSDLSNADDDGVSSEVDKLFEEASKLAEKSGVVSASFLQRHLKIGYNRAARIVESMEEMGLCGKQDGAKPREWFGRSYSNES